MEVTRAAEARIVDGIVSKATRRNWARLGVGTNMLSRLISCTAGMQT